MQRLFLVLTRGPLFKLSINFTFEAFCCFNDFASDSVFSVGQIFRKVEVVHIRKVAHLDSHFAGFQELKHNLSAGDPNL